MLCSMIDIATCIFVLDLTFNVFKNTEVQAQLNENLAKAYRRTDLLEGELEKKKAELEVLSKRIEEDKDGGKLREDLQRNVTRAYKHIEVLEGTIEAKDELLRMREAELARVEGGAGKMKEEVDDGEKDKMKALLTRKLKELEVIKGVLSATKAEHEAVKQV